VIVAALVIQRLTPLRPDGEKDNQLRKLPRSFKRQGVLALSLNATRLLTAATS
jgi:hypothetical protein